MAQSLAELQADVERVWPAWSDSGFDEELVPDVELVALALIRAAQLAKRLRVGERFYQVSNTRFVAKSIRCLCTASSGDIAASALPPQPLALLAEAAAVLGGRTAFAAELDGLLQALEPDVGLLPPREAIAVISGLASAAHCTPLLRALTAQAARQPRALSGGQTALLLWSCAVLGHAPQPLLQQPACRIVCRALPALTTRQLALCLWSLAVLEQAAPSSPAPPASGPTGADRKLTRPSGLQTGHELFAAAWEALGQRQPQEVARLPRKSLMQLHQVLLAVKHEAGAASLPESPALAPAGAVWGATAKQQKLTTSFYQRDVARCLATLGVRFLSEDTSSGWALDLLLPDHRLAIELDGPSHFCRNAPQQPLGPTAFKRRLLPKAGLAVASVPIEEWDALRGAEAQRAFLRGLLQRGAAPR